MERAPGPSIVAGDAYNRDASKMLVLGLAVRSRLLSMPADASDPRPRLPVPVTVRAAAPAWRPSWTGWPRPRATATTISCAPGSTRRSSAPATFGGLCDEEPETGLENFERVFDLGDAVSDPDEDWGWRRLGDLAARGRWGRCPTTVF